MGRKRYSDEDVLTIYNQRIEIGGDKTRVAVAWLMPRREAVAAS